MADALRPVRRRRVEPARFGCRGAQFGLSGATDGDSTAVLDLEDLPAGEKRLELWLPPTALVTIASIEIDSGARWSPWPDHVWSGR